ncbi:DinB family protein [Alsobacter sp. R-9]
MVNDRYRTFARYNQWANARLYAAAARLSDADYRADRGAFFRSVHGTLNHILVADRIWMLRFTGEGTPPGPLDTILHDDLASLTAAREAEDARIVGWVDGLTDADLAGRFRYRAVTTNVEWEQDLAPALDHFFNHQTHHRGQVHALLTGLAGAAPELDLLYYLREVGLGGMRQVA